MASAASTSPPGGPPPPPGSLIRTLSDPSQVTPTASTLFSLECGAPRALPYPRVARGLVVAVASTPLPPPSQVEELTDSDEANNDNGASGDGGGAGTSGTAIVV
ncbi:hypothetical protein N7472_006075 [Penicillium cf. griseofulvum]|uniref:Uncharacterized protein n=1 Tax=Penicillium cf. griseofulvum TaxID=2972120 RepID=A0A9W9SW88_9EURO|nr:hypothetical protein N7472_006075 [Penicillium cf. griseofulvum]